MKSHTKIFLFTTLDRHVTINDSKYAKINTMNLYTFFQQSEWLL